MDVFALRQITDAYLQALPHCWLPAAVALSAAASLVSPSVRAICARPSPRVRAVLLAAVLAGALVYAWHLRSLCDDAFISFRYADNWARGLGLVFNEGERVEGYTNFLWTALLAGGIRAGVSPGAASLVLGMAAFGAQILLAARLSARLALAGEPAPLPLAAVLLAAHYANASFATGGLETMLGSALVLGMIEAACAGRALVSGALGIAATMTRPDHAVFYAAAGAALFLDPKRRSELRRYGLPFFAVYLPYFLMRWRYYGALLPNTFYAKSVSGHDFEHGFTYAFSFLVGGGVWAVLPLASYGFVKLRQQEHLFLAFAAMALPVYIYYVLRIGGDFMFGRFFVPILPIVLLLAEAGFWRVLRRLAADRPWLIASAACLMAVPSLPARLVPPAETRWQMADERTFWPLVSISPLRIKSAEFDRGEALRRHVYDRGLRWKIAVPYIGMVGYLSRLPIVDWYGLIDPVLARQPPLRRGRPGHEKVASISYLLSRGSVLLLAPAYTEVPTDLTALRLGRETLFLGRWDAPEMARLTADSEVSGCDMPAFIDRFARRRRLYPEAAVAHRLAFFDAFYFAHNADPARRMRSSAHGVSASPATARSAVAPGDAALDAEDLAFALERAGRLDDAVGAYRESLRHERDVAGRAPRAGTLATAVDFSAIHNGLGDALRRLGRLPEALAEFQAAVAVEPRSFSAFNNVGITLADMGRSDEAIAAYRTALHLYSEFAPAWSNLGNVYFRTGDLSRAEAAYATAVMLDPGLPDGHNNLGSVYFRRNQVSRAVAEFRAALALRPDSPAIRKNLEIALAASAP